MFSENNVVRRDDFDEESSKDAEILVDNVHSGDTSAGGGLYWRIGVHYKPAASDWVVDELGRAVIIRLGTIGCSAFGVAIQPCNHCSEEINLQEMFLF